MIMSADYMDIRREERQIGKQSEKNALPGKC